MTSSSVCTDGLAGFPEAIDAVFPQRDQPDLHRPRRPPVPAVLVLARPQDAAPPNCDASTPPLMPKPPAGARTSSRPNGPTTPAAKTRTRGLGPRVGAGSSPFLAFPDEIRRIIYTTNAVESLHSQIRKTIKTRGQFPNDDAALRLIWLAITARKPAGAPATTGARRWHPPHPLRRPHPQMNNQTAYTKKRAPSSATQTATSPARGREGIRERHLPDRQPRRRRAASRQGHRGRSRRLGR